MVGKLRKIFDIGLVALTIGLVSLSLKDQIRYREGRKLSLHSDYKSRVLNTGSLSTTNWTKPKLEEIAYNLTNNFSHDSLGEFLCREIPADDYTDGDPEFTKALNHSNFEPVLGWFYFNTDSCINRMKPIIANLSSNQDSILPFYNIEMEYHDSRKNCSSNLADSQSWNVIGIPNATKSVLVLLYKGMRVAIFSGGGVENPRYGINCTDSQIIRNIKKKTEKTLKK